MNLRLTVALTVLILAVVLHLLVASVTSTLLAQRFARLEARDVRQELVNLDRALAGRFADLDAKVVDWSMWGECHAYLLAPDTEFVNRTVTPAWMGEGRIGLIAFVNAAGVIVDGRQYHPTSQSVQNLVSEQREQLAAHPTLISHAETTATAHGLIILDGEPWLAASRPSLDDEGAGPIHGSVIVARRLDRTLVEELGRGSGGDLSVIAADAGASDPLWSRFKHEKDLPVIPVDEDLVSGFLPLRDISGQIRWVLRLDAPRSMWSEGRSARRTVAVVTALTTLVAAFIAWLLLDRMIITRLVRLERQTQDLPGRTQHVSVTGSDVVGRLGDAVNRVIDDRSGVQQALQVAREDAQAAATAKADLLSALGHELRTPLTGILGMIRLIEKEQLTDQTRDYVEVMRSSGDNILALVQDLMDVSRLESGKLELERMVFEPRTVLEDAILLHSERADQKRIELTAIIDASLPRHVEGDQTRFRQIVHNMVGTALKYTERGEIVVRLQSDSGGSTANEIGFRLVVRDTGTGIPRSVQDRLFARAQGDESSSSNERRTAGSGLGLTICKHLAEHMGGGLTLESGSAGSVVTVALRFGRVQAAPGSDTLPGAFPSRRALIVDPHAPSREGLRHSLRGLGYECEEAGDLEHAKLLLGSEGSYAFVLVSAAVADAALALPDAAKALAPVFAGLPIILLAPLLQRRRFSDVPGVSAVLSKPVRQVHLREVVSRLATGTGDDEAIDPLGEDVSARSGLRALVVDDSHINQRVSAGMLKRLGCVVDVAAHGLEGLGMLRRRRYDLVILDCQMPVMDGYTMAEQWRREESADRRVLIVAVTADASSSARDRCLNAGMDDYLSKPVEFETLAASVRRSLSRRSDGSGKLPAIHDPRKGRPQSGELDHDMLSQVRILGEEGFRKVIDRYLEAMPERMAHLEAAMAKPDLEQVGIIAHQIVGESGLVGLRRLEHLAREVEIAARSDQRIVHGHLDLLRLAFTSGSELLLQARDTPESAG